MLPRRITPRAWIWVSVCVQLSGLAFDATWHGLLNPGFEAVTISQMARHLASVHLLLYSGVVSVLLSTGWALLDQLWRGEYSLALPVAFAGALLSTAGEGWHSCQRQAKDGTHTHIFSSAPPIVQRLREARGPLGS
jgi:hypothetical protein